MRQSLRVAALLPALLGGLACAPRDLAPEAAYQAFARAAAERDAEAGWALLSRPSRERLDARARAAAARAPGVVAESGQRLLFGDAALGVHPPREVKLLRHDADRVTLRVVDAGGAAGEVQMVREEGAWRLELPASGWP